MRAPGGGAGPSRPASEPLVGVDVGGTSVKLGALAPDGRRVARESAVETDADEPGEAGPMLDLVAERLRELLGGAVPSRGIGVGMPGLLDRSRGVVLESPNLPAFDGYPVRAELARRVGLPAERVWIENDANVAALGEARLGAARGVPNVLLVTLGTGVGGGLILGGELVLGEGLACEVGHVKVVPDGLPCGCGRRGCVEQYASATAASRRARERGLPAEAPGDLERLSAAARAGGDAERELLLEVGVDLGHALAAALVLVDVRTYVFGGGFSAALDLLAPGVRRGLEEWGFGRRVEEVRLVRAALGPAAGWIGAAHLVLERRSVP